MTHGILEITVLSLLRKRENYIKYKDMLSKDFFSSMESRTIWKMICKFHEEIKRPFCDAKALWLLLEKYIDEDDREMYFKLCVKIKNTNTQDEEVADVAVRKFMQGHMTLAFLQEMALLKQSGQDIDPHEMRLRVERICQMNGQFVENTYDWYSSVDARLAENITQGRIPTGIAQDLDMSMSGGLGEGELGLFLGPPKRGKSLTLVNVGSNALRIGKRVLHVTLEIRDKLVGRRYDQCLTRCSYLDLVDSPQKITELRAALRPDQLVIKDFSPQGGCTVGELHAFTSKLHDKNPFDLIIVDFADLIHSKAGYKDSRQATDANYRDLRAMAGELKIPIWTASQGNRQAETATTLNLTHMAESYNKGGIVDIVIGLSQTVEELEENEMRVHIMASRIGPKGKMVRCVFDTDRMLLESTEAAEGRQVGLILGRRQRANRSDRPRNDADGSSTDRGQPKQVQGEGDIFS